ncbi:Uncharacterised protein [Shigella sonnei]|nr:Uncharacterised protein [Shigella sonnei]
MRPSIIFATAEYVKRLREECLRENKPLHRHTRFRRQELAPDEINPDVLAMGGHIARRCSEQKRVRIPAGGIRSSGPTPTGSCWRTRQSPPNPLARFRAAATVRCLKNQACSDRSGRAASVAP